MDLTVLTQKLSEGVKELNALIEVTRGALATAKEEQRVAKEAIADVELREKKVVEQEHRLATADELEKQQSDLVTAKSEFLKEQKAHAQKVQEVRATYEQQAVDLASREADLKRREEALEKEKAEYKDRIRNELSRVSETI